MNFNKILHMHFIDIGIGEEWYGIASGIISFRNSIVMALVLHFAFPYFSTELWPLIYVQNVFLPNIFQINGYISRKFC